MTLTMTSRAPRAVGARGESGDLLGTTTVPDLALLSRESVGMSGTDVETDGVETETSELLQTIDRMPSDQVDPLVDLLLRQAVRRRTPRR